MMIHLLKAPSSPNASLTVLHYSTYNVACRADRRSNVAKTIIRLTPSCAEWSDDEGEECEEEGGGRREVGHLIAECLYSDICKKK